MLRPKEIPALVETVLLEWEEAEILLVRDRVGTQYLCTRFEGRRFLAVQLSAQRLADFRSGKVDLRELLIDPELGLHYEATLSEDGHSLGLTLMSEEPPEAWLPEPGFLLSDFYDEIDESEVVREAASRNAVMLTYHLEPSGSSAAGPNAIDAIRLSKYVGTIQILIRHAWTRVKPKNVASYRDDPEIQVLAFSPGSFRIHFSSKYPANAIGTSDVGAALGKVDELVALTEVDDAEKRLEVLKNNRGHVIAAYRELLSLVAEEPAPLTYRWAEPSMSKAGGMAIRPTAAAEVVALIKSRQDLGHEDVILRGTFIRIASDLETWRLKYRDEKNKSRTVGGKVHEDAGDVLKGLAVDSTEYRLVCEKRLEGDVQGTLSAAHYLKSVTIASGPTANRKHP